MKYLIAFVFFLTTILSVTSSSAVGQTTGQDRAVTLRSQLSDLDTKQSELQTRLQELEEKLKPENIEKSLAGVGSTRPEELREQKRRQLELERNGVRSQLDVVAASRTRLEASLARADADAYRQSAAPPSVATQTAVSETSPGSASVDAATTPEPRRRVRKKRSRRVRRTHHMQKTLVAPTAPENW